MVLHPRLSRSVRWAFCGAVAVATTLPALAHADEAANAPTSQSATKPAVEITVDTSQVPEMNDYGVTVKKVADEWYPIICRMLPGDNFTPPDHVMIVFVKDKPGVADTQNNLIRCAPAWFKEHPDDVGAIVHELAHVSQHYTIGRRPGWLVEGIADWVRWFNYEPLPARPHPDPRTSKYSDSYRTSAAFLDWCCKKYDKDLVVEINEDCRRGRYRPEVWKGLTGFSVEELGEQWKQQLQGK